MTFAVKAKVTDVSAKTFAFRAQKTMYGGKQITKGDTIFVFASENEGSRGLIASELSLLLNRFQRNPALPAKRRA